MQLGKMQLHIESENSGVHTDYLNDSELQIIANKVWKNSEIRDVHNMVTTCEEENLPDGWDAKRLEELRAKIHHDFDGTALREELFPDPPVRGMFGYAYIPLEEDAIPTRQKPFQMYGERQEAFKQIVLDWVEKKFIERPTKGGVE